MDAEESKIYIRILVFCVLLAIILIAFTVSFFKQQHKLNKEKIKAEIEASEKERKKLAADLHDDLGPILATIKIYVNALSATATEDTALITNINKYLDGGITRIKIMANGLMPNTLQRKGLQKALEEFVFNIKPYVPFKIDFIFPDMAFTLSHTAALNIYRIIQEIITNAIKHAKASLLQLTFEERENNFIIYIIDNGVGFDYTDHNFVSSGYGISNIKSRVEVLEGKYTLYSKPGEGICYTLIIPINKNIQHE